jgi:Chemotaxis phosphatase CheX
VSVTEVLEENRTDLDEILSEVVQTVFHEEAFTLFDLEESGALREQPHALTSLAIHDKASDLYTAVEVRMGVRLAMIMASTMFSVAEPENTDVLDAMGELGNIIGGNVKSLIPNPCRLSLPMARIIEETSKTPPEGNRTETTACVSVLGQVVELIARDGADPSSVFWPGDVMER